MAMKILRVFFFGLLLLQFPLFQVVRCQSEIEADVEGSKLGIVREDVQDFVGSNFKPAPGVETICFFPRNSAKVVPAGEKTELLVGMENVGESPLNIITIEASVHLPFDHRMLVQNLTAQVFDNASVPPSTQATFPYIFALSKFLQKTKAASKVEVGTGTTDASMDEWLQGTAYNQSSSKSKKKK
ncbi:hypothetical protein ERO13_A12G039300v2 [Gossypium hirsutum]|nr:hypothetical protein ERO13_A12G039300v2 [Gossypium hirsutum]